MRRFAHSISRSNGCNGQLFYVVFDVLDRLVFFRRCGFTLRLCISLCQAVYSASFPEDIPTNKGILAVGATDADSGSSAEIQYSLFGIGVEDFYMDANTGTLSYYFSLGFCMIKKKYIYSTDYLQLYTPLHLYRR